jgi:hypothetical protein
MAKVFRVSLMLKVDKSNNILSSSEVNHEEDVWDLISDVFYDVDDIKITQLNVTEEKE